jgi:uncharacterized iron-regulated membrane protein
LIRPIHTWIGLISGLFITIISLSGSVIVFRSQFEKAMLPPISVAMDSGHRVRLDDIAEQVARVRPNARIRRLRLPASPQDPYIIQIQSGDKQERLVSDAYSGRMLGVVGAGWIDRIVDLHRNLLSGRTGRKIVGAFGIVLFVLSATGILLWLLGARNWRALIATPRRGASRRFNLELHRLIGIWAYCLLAVVSFTGVGISYPDTFRQAWQLLTGHPAVSQVKRKFKIDGPATQSLDEYLAIGSRAMKDATPTELRLPDTGKGPVELRLSRPGDLSAGSNRVYLDPVSARVLAIDRAADRPLGARFLGAFSPVHYGQIGGFFAKVLWVLLGLVPTVLLVTGLIVWLRPSKAKPSQTGERVRAAVPALTKQ